MASILKVDQLQKPDGSTPTAADLGIDDAGRIINYETRLTPVTSFSAGTADVWYTVYTFTYTPTSDSSLIMLELHTDSINASAASSYVKAGIFVDGVQLSFAQNQGRNYSYTSQFQKAVYTNTSSATKTIEVKLYPNLTGLIYAVQTADKYMHITEISQ